MMELLIVVAILVILCSIITLAVLALSKDMRFKQKNDYAKTIFMAAQANLTNLRSNGELPKLLDEGVNDLPITEELRDKVAFPLEQWSDEYVYTSSEFADTSAAFNSYALVLPVGSVESYIRDKQVIIEYNPITGNVYSVFYSDNSESMLTLYRSGQLPRDEESRRELEIGYYCGSGLSSMGIDMEGTEVSVEYINGQEGYISLQITPPESMSGNRNAFMNGLDVSLSLTGETSGARKTVNIMRSSGSDVADCTWIDGNVLKVTYMMDSLADSKSFANLAAGDYSGSMNFSDIKSENNLSFLPGENLLIQSEVSFSGSGASVKLDTTILPSVNPMFEYLKPSGSAGKYILAVSNGRNLQNLNALTPSIADAVEIVLFTDDIFWNDTVTYYNNVYMKGETYTNAAAEAPGRALPYFVPIHNEMLFGTAKFNGGTLDYSVDPALSGNTAAVITGNGKRVVGLNIDSRKYAIPNGGEYYVSAGYKSGGTTVGGKQVVNYQLTGLFGYVNTKVTGLTVVNSFVRGLDGTGVATGSLVGAAGYNSYFASCGAYLMTEPNAVKGNYDFSAMSGPKTPSTLDQNWYGVGGAGSVGGLVGHVESKRVTNASLTENESVLTFSRCFSAVPVGGQMASSSGTNNGIGGLVGTSYLANYYACYSSGDIYSTGGYTATKSSNWNDIINMDGSKSAGAGGFVGTSFGSRYSNCFSTGDLNSSTNSRLGSFAGIMCYDGSLTISSSTYKQISLFESCYVTGRLNGKTGSAFTGGNAAVNLGNHIASTSKLYTDYYLMMAPYFAVVRNITNIDKRDLASDLTFPTTTDGYKASSVNYYYIAKDCYYLDMSMNVMEVTPSATSVASGVCYDLLMDLVAAHSGGSGWEKDQWDNILTWTMDTGSSFYDSYYHLYVHTGVYEDFIALQKGYKNRIANAYPDTLWVDTIENTESNTHSYNLSGGKYNFPMFDGMVYYGDWPTLPLSGGLAYFEYYSNDDNVHAQFDRADEGDLLTNEQLRAAGASIISDGYAVVVPSTSLTVKIKINTSTTTLNKSTAVPWTTIDGTTVYLYPLTRTVLNQTANRLNTEGYYVKATLTIGSDTYITYFNPYTANSQINPVMIDAEDYTVPDLPASAPEQIEVRTARQLYGLAQTTMRNFWNQGYNYIQTMDIDAKTYTLAKGYSSTDKTGLNSSFTSTNAIANTSGSAFNGTYTGIGNGDAKPKIANFFGRKALGIFTTIGETGAVKNLQIWVNQSVTWSYSTKVSCGLVADDNKGTIEGVDITITVATSLTAKTNAGFVAGISRGVIRNCTVLITNSPTITAATTAGLLVGDLTGTFQNCSVRCTNGKVTLSASNAGGAVGSAKDANIKDIATAIYSLTVSTTGANAGGFAGSLEAGAISNINVDLSVGGSSSLTAMGGFAGKITNGNIANCAVTLGKLQANTVAGWTPTASGLTLENCEITITNTLTGTTAAAGAIATVSGSGVFRNITVNIDGGSITASSGKAAGFAVTLLGETAKTHVKLDGATISGTEAAGFAHTVTGQVSDHCSMAGSGTISGSSKAGGFAVSVTGSVAASRVTPALEQTPEAYWGNSNNNLVINGGTSAGFVVSVASGAAIRNCDAIGKITGTTISGFADANSGQLDGCIANVTVTGGNAFVRSNSGTVSNCYGWHSGATTIPTASSKNYYTSYFGDIDIKEENAGTTAGVVLFDSNGNYSKITPVELTSAYGILGEDAAHKWFIPGTYSSYSYSMSASYPYPMLREHGGNWASSPVYPFGVVYYERYTSGSTRYHVVDLSSQDNSPLNFYAIGSATQSGNCFDTSGTISEAGYLVFCRTGSDPLGGGVIGNQFTGDAVIANTINSKAGGGYSVYTLNSNNAVQIVRKGQIVTVYPFFADSIGSGSPYQIRTADQLASMSKVSGSFVQTRNITVPGNFNVVGQSKGTNASVSAGSTYEGNGYSITATSADNTWMDTLYGTLQNLTITVGPLKDDLIRTVGNDGKITNVNVVIAGSLGANGSIVGKTSGTVSIPKVTINAQTMEGRIVENITGGTVTVGQVSATASGSQIKGLFGSMTAGQITGTTIDLSKATVTGNLFTAVTGGSTVSGYTITAGTVNDSIFGTLTGTVSGLTITVETANVGFSTGVLVNNMAAGTTSTGDPQPIAVTNCQLNVTNITSQASVFGTITGTAPDSATLTDCTVNVTNLAAESGIIGGMVGINSASVVNCVVNVTVNVSDTTFIGGIAAQNTGNINGFLVDLNINYTQTKSTMPHTVFGGLVGQMNGGSVTGKTNAKNVTGTFTIVDQAANSRAKRKYVAGGAVGECLASATFKNIYANVKFAGKTWSNDYKVSANVTDEKGNGPIGKFIGYAKTGTFTSCTAATATNFAACGQKESAVTTISAASTDGAELVFLSAGWDDSARKERLFV